MMLIAANLKMARTIIDLIIETIEQDHMTGIIDPGLQKTDQGLMKGTTDPDHMTDPDQMIVTTNQSHMIETTDLVHMMDKGNREEITTTETEDIPMIVVAIIPRKEDLLMTNITPAEILHMIAIMARTDPKAQDTSHREMNKAMR